MRKLLPCLKLEQNCLNLTLTGLFSGFFYYWKTVARTFWISKLNFDDLTFLNTTKILYMSNLIYIIISNSTMFLIISQNITTCSRSWDTWILCLERAFPHYTSVFQSEVECVYFYHALSKFHIHTFHFHIFQKFEKFKCYKKSKHNIVCTPPPPFCWGVERPTKFLKRGGLTGTQL